MLPGFLQGIIRFFSKQMFQCTGRILRIETSLKMADSLISALTIKLGNWLRHASVIVLDSIVLFGIVFGFEYVVRKQEDR